MRIREDQSTFQEIVSLLNDSKFIQDSQGNYLHSLHGIDHKITLTQKTITISVKQSSVTNWDNIISISLDIINQTQLSSFIKKFGKNPQSMKPNHYRN